ncbi:MAG: winged helix-turn-helix domain-containing protein, partial [Bdellovibrionota bacterium]
MKTDTKIRLIQIIETNGPARPVDLTRLLGISSQAVHRQLRALVSDGVLESRGSPPATFYALAGMPDFSKAFEWLSAARLSKNPASHVCETRDVFTARLSSLRTLVKQGLPTEDLPLLISVVGEIGNNSFDHNLGQWRDVPGCWYEIQVTRNLLWVIIADRGQGIFQRFGRERRRHP